MKSTTKLGLLSYGLLGFALVTFLTAKFGPGTTPDSASYLSAALSLAHEGRLLNYDGSVFVHWPPLFPMLLAPGGPSTLPPPPFWVSGPVW